MKLTVNGKPQEYAGEPTLKSFVAHLQLNSERIAAELNLTIVPRGAWEATMLHDGDRLEIVHFVGGGSL